MSNLSSDLDHFGSTEQKCSTGEICSDHHDQELGQENKISEYASEPRLRDLPFNLFNFPRWILLALIRLYQKIISPTLPSNTCRFYPSCSHYGYQAVYKYGVLRGSWMALCRLLRCNPFNPGGYDPVP